MERQTDKAPQLNTEWFGAELKLHGFSFYSGVPCSYLKGLINYAINTCDYVAAANEGDAVAICSGAALGGRRSVALFQNSGLTNATSPLTSLNYTFKLPILGFVSLRGDPEAAADEPQHELMGRITCEMLTLMEVRWEVLSPVQDIAAAQLRRASETIAEGHTFFFVVKQGTLSSVDLANTAIPSRSNETLKLPVRAATRPHRADVLRRLTALRAENTYFLATTGVTGRELYTISDDSRNLYMVGSMGCVSSIALGLARAQPDKRIVAIDGDGSVLMRLGALATNGSYGTDNLLHVVLDNNVHESTGCQGTVSHNVDLVQVAASCGYSKVQYIHDLQELDTAYLDWQQNGGLTCWVVPTSAGLLQNLGRPTIKPHEVKKRFIQRLNA